MSQHLLHHIGIRVYDLEATTKFYKESFDAQIISTTTAKSIGKTLRFLAMPDSSIIELVADIEKGDKPFPDTFDHIAYYKLPLKSAKHITNVLQIPEIKATAVFYAEGDSRALVEQICFDSSEFDPKHRMKGKC